MITCFDSAFPPSSATAQAAAAAGIKGWFGYLSTAPYDGDSHFGLYHPWPLEAIEWVRACNPNPVMFVSGMDNPLALKALAIQLNVKICLDVEGGIRSDGPWVQGWLDASGAGLYGNYGVHINRRAAFYVLAAYPGIGDPAGTWWNQTPRPPGPCGWQWVGTHSEFGVGVDRGDYDDWFYQIPDTIGDDMPVLVCVDPSPGSGKPAYELFRDLRSKPSKEVKAQLLLPELTILVNAGTVLHKVSQADLDAIPDYVPGSDSGMEPPEPTEPKTVTLNIPAQQISGILS
jgi:hypothetical protein